VYSVEDWSDGIVEKPGEGAIVLLHAATHPCLCLIFVLRPAIGRFVSPPIISVKSRNIVAPISSLVKVFVHFLVLEEETPVTEVAGD